LSFDPLKRYQDCVDHPPAGALALENVIFDPSSEFFTSSLPKLSGPGGTEAHPLTHRGTRKAATTIVLLSERLKLRLLEASGLKVGAAESRFLLSALSGPELDQSAFAH
jgi:hypothetical protein